MANYANELQINGKDVMINVNCSSFLSERLYRKNLWKEIKKQELNDSNFIGLEEIEKRKLVESSSNFLLDVIVQILSDNPKYITYSPFLVNLRIRRLSIHAATYDKRSTEAVICIRVSYKLLLIGLPLKLQKKEYDIRQTSTYQIIDHEFLHHLDRDFIKQSIVTADILMNRMGVGIYDIVSKVRIEGLATYKQTLYSKEIALNFEAAKILKEYIKSLLSNQESLYSTKFLKIIYGYGYKIGPIMCFTIALAQLKDVAKSQESRASINEISEDLIECIRIGEKVAFPNLPPEINIQVINLLLKTDVDGFLKTYEIALRKLKIPEQFGVITFKSFKRLIIKGYLNYVNITLPMIDNRPFYKKFMMKILEKSLKPISKYISDYV